MIFYLRDMVDYPHPYGQDDQHSCRDITGYVLACDLREPSLGTSFGSNIETHLAPSEQQRLKLQGSLNVDELFDAFQGLIGWSGLDLVSVTHLKATIAPVYSILPQMTPLDAYLYIVRDNIAPDGLALAFAAIALGSIAVGELSLGSLFFGISTELVKHCVGCPTLATCLVNYLHYMVSLHIGATSNHARGFVIQAIQYAHDLRLQQGSHGIRGLEIYLLLYMADQYVPQECSTIY